MAVAVVETFDRLHPLAAPSDANAVADMFEVPSPWKMARVVDVYSLPVGVLKMVTIQFDPSDDGCTLTPIACGVPPGPVIRPDTITYSTAASTTVMATIRMVAITGDTAASSFRMMLFMVLSSCGLRRHLGTGEPTLLNVSWLIFEVENEFIRARAAREKSPNRNRPTQAGIDAIHRLKPRVRGLRRTRARACSGSPPSRILASR